MRWSVGMRATGHWGEPPGVVSEVPPKCPRPFPQTRIQVLSPSQTKHGAENKVGLGPLGVPSGCLAPDPEGAEAS